MRHALTTRFVLTAAAVAALAAVLFAVLANSSSDSTDRIDVILGLDADAAAGRLVYSELTQPTCATCHTLRDAEAESDRALSLDSLRPSARVTVASLLSGTVGAHDAQSYEHALADQEIADLAAYIERVAGN